MSLLGVFANVLLPIFILLTFGFLLDRRFSPDIRSLSRVAFYVLSPSLIFSSLVNSTVSGADSSRIFVFVILSTALMALVALLTCRLLRLDRITQSAFLLATLLLNSGNFGLSVNLFAFGEAGLERAALFFVGSAVLANTVGVFIAAHGRTNLKEALLSVLKAPMVYAAASAFAVNALHIQLPEPLLKTMNTAGQGAVPVMLLILGMQLARTSLQNDIPLIGVATALRLVVAAVVAWGLAAVMSLEGVTRQVCIVEASTPTAVTSLILATEFDARPQLVTGVIFLSSLASMLTLTVLIHILL